MSIAITVADAVKDELNNGSYSESFIAERVYVPDYSLPEMKELHVTVVPRHVEVSLAGRGRTQHCAPRADVPERPGIQQGVRRLCLSGLLVVPIAAVAGVLAGRPSCPARSRSA